MSSIVLLWILAASGPSLGRQEPPSDPAAVEEIARRILKLRREADRLLEELPADLRRRVEARIEALDARDRATTDSSDEPPASAEETVSSEQPRAAETPESAPLAPTGRAPHDASPTTDRSRVRCRPLAPFDGNGDGAVDGADRAWRHFYLWRDDGDGRLAETEVTSLYDAGVRGLDTGLRSVRVRGDRTGSFVVGAVLAIEIPAGKRRTTRGALAVDASGLRRAGEPIPITADGEAPDGFLVLTPHLELRRADGSHAALSCPGG